MKKVLFMIGIILLCSLVQGVTSLVLGIHYALKGVNPIFQIIYSIVNTGIGGLIAVLVIREKI